MKKTEGIDGIDRIEGVEAVVERQPEQKEENQRKKRKKFKKDLFLTTLYGICLCLFNKHVLGLGVIYGNSMDPTLHHQQVVLIYKWNYTPKVGDIVVTNTENPTGLSLTKRVIASGEDCLSVEGQTIKLNGVLLSEPYLPPDQVINTFELFGTYDLIELILPSETVFLMGDNRNYSTDSRHFGSLSWDKIIGKIIVY